MILFCVWGGTHQAKQLSLKPVPPIPQRESQRMLSDMNQAALSRRSPTWGRLSAYLQKREFWLYRDTAAAYFGDGEAFFRDLIEHLRQAETYIFMEYYILAEGTVWDEIFAVLKERGGPWRGNSHHCGRFRDADPAFGRNAARHAGGRY